MKSQCKPQRGKEQPRKWKCNDTGCNQKFNSQKGLTKHSTYHCHPHAQQIMMIRKTKTAKKQTGKHLQEGIPRETASTYNNNVRYNAETQKWERNHCAKKYGPLSMRNAIQHACKHNRRIQKTQERKWEELPLTQTQLRDCRIRTLHTYDESPLGNQTQDECALK